MTQVYKYQLSDEETATWRDDSTTGQAEREFLVRVVTASRKPGDTVQLFDAWGELVKEIKVS